jgi:hypothetical protein
MEPYTAAVACFGLTAADVGRNPASTQARDAASAWAGRALALGGKANIAADDTKKALAQAHERAASGKANWSPTLGDCLSAFRTAKSRASR